MKKEALGRVLKVEVALKSSQKAELETPQSLKKTFFALPQVEMTMMMKKKKKMKKRGKKEDVGQEKKDHLFQSVVQR